VRWEGDDPYLVVAADKGTATFSDIANGVSADVRLLAGDAFASGGSVGYDHKVMGITARGAWEAVKRHFREIGKDIQTEPFTVVGVGDMSGDVFGNGMLLSKAIKLVAAFDHRDIFIDPDPDPASSWVERDRMFKPCRARPGRTTTSPRSRPAAASSRARQVDRADAPRSRRRSTSRKTSWIRRT
jgi:glutamate dehydrogenase